MAGKPGCYKKPHKYTPQQSEFIAANVEGVSTKDLAAMVNDRFGTSLSERQIHSYKKNNKLKSGLTGHYAKGSEPWNKGLKGVNGFSSTRFNPGEHSWNRVPIGTERITRDGYVEVKTRDGHGVKNWRGKHILVWQEHHGKKVPAGHVVIFGDGNHFNFEPDNLILVSRKQLVRLNQNELIADNADLTRTGVLIADVYNKIGERRRSKK